MINLSNLELKAKLLNLPIIKNDWALAVKNGDRWQLFTELGKVKNEFITITFDNNFVIGGTHTVKKKYLYYDTIYQIYIRDRLNPVLSRCNFNAVTVSFKNQPWVKSSTYSTVKNQWECTSQDDLKETFKNGDLAIASTKQNTYIIDKFGGSLKLGDLYSYDVMITRVVDFDDYADLYFGFGMANSKCGRIIKSNGRIDRFELAIGT